jgi:hypothetical protein
MLIGLSWLDKCVHLIDLLQRRSRRGFSWHRSAISQPVDEEENNVWIACRRRMTLLSDNAICQLPRDLERRVRR